MPNSQTQSESSLLQARFIKLLFLLQLFCTLFMTGLIWFVQIVHYPLFNLIAVNSFANYETVHCQVTTSVVALPMIIEAVTAGFLVIARPASVSRLSAWVGLILVGTIWFATLFFSIPNHSILSAGFNERAYRELCNLNWIRTIAWSLRSALMLFWITQMIPANRLMNAEEAERLELQAKSAIQTPSTHK